jgi:hypothetical protein
MATCMVNAGFAVLLNYSESGPLGHSLPNSKYLNSGLGLTALPDGGLAYYGKNAAAYWQPDGTHAGAVSYMVCSSGCTGADPVGLGVAYGVAPDSAPVSGGVLPGGYTDINVSAGHVVGVTAGIVVSEGSGVHWYVGGGLVEGASVAITRSPSSVTSGWNVGAQLTLLGASGQYGISLRDKSQFWEVGGGAPLGASVTGYYVSEPVLPPFWVIP